MIYITIKQTKLGWAWAPLGRPDAISQSLLDACNDALRWVEHLVGPISEVSYTFGDRPIVHTPDGWISPYSEQTHPTLGGAVLECVDREPSGSGVIGLTF